MYICGPTVYSTPHIGNARPAVVFDQFYRLLRRVYSPEHVIYARNITDVDDKIIDKAKETGKSTFEITKETTEWYHEDMKSLHVLSPNIEPRATESIEEMSLLIEELLEKRHAYMGGVAGDEPGRNIYFDLSSFPEHGKLSRHKREDLQSQEEEAERLIHGKKHPQDFALWKTDWGEDDPEQAEKDGRMWFDINGGFGRPGWNLECSAMIRKHLGITIDVHGGGSDLRFPHHENEIAQSETANGAPPPELFS